VLSYDTRSSCSILHDHFASQAPFKALRHGAVPAAGSARRRFDAWLSATRSQGIWWIMATEAGAVLLLKRAKLGKEPGVLTISTGSLAWKPNDPGAAQQATSVAVSAITSEFQVLIRLSMLRMDACCTPSVHPGRLRRMIQFCRAVHAGLWCTSRHSHSLFRLNLVGTSSASTRLRTFERHIRLQISSGQRGSRSCALSRSASPSSSSWRAWRMSTR